MFFNVLHGVLVYSPEAKFIVNGPKNKRIYRYYPLKCFVLVPLIQFLKMDRLLQTNGSHFGLLRRLSGQLLMSGMRFSRDVTKALRELRFMPFCIAWPFLGVILQYIPIA